MGAKNAATQKMIENIIDGITPPTRANSAEIADRVIKGLKFGSKTYDGSAEQQITTADIGAEPAFNKNTAFNKNFGTAAGTVCQGNDVRLSDARKVKSTNTSSKIYLIGTTSQDTNGADTYSHDTAYVGADGHLYSGGNHVAETYTGNVLNYSIVYPIGTILIIKGSTDYANPTNDNNGYNTVIPVYAVKNANHDLQEYLLGGPFSIRSSNRSQLTGTWRFRGCVIGNHYDSGSAEYYLVQRTA